MLITRSSLYLGETFAYATCLPLIFSALSSFCCRSESYLYNTRRYTEIEEYLYSRSDVHSKLLGCYTSPLMGEATSAAIEEGKLHGLYRDYDIIDARTRLDPRNLQNHQFITELLKTDPSLYFFLNCELRTGYLIEDALRDAPHELRDELERVIADREAHRILIDRIKERRQELAKVLRVSPDVAIRDAKTEHLLLQGVRNAFEKRRDRVYELLKIILWQKRLKTDSDKERIYYDGQLHFLSVIQMFHRSRAFAQKAHHRVKQVRGSGEAYIFHPLSVALRTLLAARTRLTKPGTPPDPRILVFSGNTHDVPEDTPVTLDELEYAAYLAYLEFEKYRLDRSLVQQEAQNFAEKVRQVVELDTEDLAMRALPKVERELAMMQRLAEARPNDIRQLALMVKYSDRTHNVETLEGMGDPEKIRRKLRSTIEWCTFALGNEKEVDTLGLGAELADQTFEAYKAFREDHDKFMEEQDETNIKDIRDLRDCLANDSSQSFLPDEYNATLYYSEEEARARRIGNLAIDVEELEEDDEAYWRRIRVLDDERDFPRRRRERHDDDEEDEDE